MKWEYLIQPIRGEKMLKNVSDTPDGEVEDDENDIETEDVLLARMYDLCLAIDQKIIQINEVEDEDGQGMIVIILKNTKYSGEKGFEKIT